MSEQAETMARVVDLERRCEEAERLLREHLAVCPGERALKED